MTRYYEKYWRSQGHREGVANLPPEWNEDDLERVLGFLKPVCRGDVLDVGCGNGVFTVRLKNYKGVKKVIGVDVSHEAIRQAKGKYPSVDFRVTAAETFPFGDGSFDLVTLVDVAEHVIDVEGLFLEIGRILKDSGILFITTTDFNWIKRVLIAAFFWEKYFYPQNPHIRFFTKCSLSAILKKAGFEVFAHQWHGSYFGVMPKGQLVLARKTKKCRED